MDLECHSLKLASALAVLMELERSNQEREGWSRKGGARAEEGADHLSQQPGVPRPERVLAVRVAQRDSACAPSSEHARGTRGGRERAHLTTVATESSTHHSNHIFNSLRPADYKKKKEREKEESLDSSTGGYATRADRCLGSATPGPRL